MALGAGHRFIVFLGEGYCPVNVLNAIKMVRRRYAGFSGDRESG